MKLKRIISIVFVILMLYVSLIDFFSFAETSGLKVEASKDEVNLDEEFYIIIDTSEVEINEFDVSIINSFNLTSTGVADDEKTEVEMKEKSSNEIKFKVDKINTDSSKFAVYYLAPSQETNIKFTVSLNGHKEIITEEMFENVVTEKVTYEPISLTEKITVSVKKKEVVLNEIGNKVPGIVNGIENKVNVENGINNNVGNMNFGNVIGNKPNDKEQELGSKEEFSEEELDKMFGGTRKEMQTEMLNMKEKMQALQSENLALNDKIMSSQVTYQGSFNNYLKSLVITDVEIKNEFHKTISTYFAEVDETVDKVTVKAVAEDSSAIVTIVGNDKLQTGKNKILINVTADDNSVRTYRIYVTKN